MRRLSKRQILLLHGEMIGNFGGMDGLRDDGTLDSAAQIPFQTYDGHELFPSLMDKAARLGYGILQGHPFLDGNKRTGTHAMLVFLAINGILLAYADDDLIKIIYKIASGRAGEDDLLIWLRSHVSPAERTKEQ